MCAVIQHHLHIFFFFISLSLSTLTPMLLMFNIVLQRISLLNFRCERQLAIKFTRFLSEQKEEEKETKMYVWKIYNEHQMAGPIQCSTEHHLRNENKISIYFKNNVFEINKTKCLLSFLYHFLFVFGTEWCID